MEDTAEEPKSVAELDGSETVILCVRKQSGESTGAVVNAVQGKLDEIRASLPPGAALDIVSDNAETIRTAVHSVTEHLVVGGILAALVVLVFLRNARSTLIAAVAIPISTIGTFALIWAMSFTLNVLTALALAVGIVVDDAIVVLENIAPSTRNGRSPFFRPSSPRGRSASPSSRRRSRSSQCSSRSPSWAGSSAAS